MWINQNLFTAMLLVPAFHAAWAISRLEKTHPAYYADNLTGDQHFQFAGLNRHQHFMYLNIVKGGDNLGNLFTIGHSRHEIDYFICLIKQYHIDYLLDVRSTPYSNYTEHFNKENLSPILSVSGIQYFFMGKYFGARPQETALYDANGCLDFDRVRDSKNFKAGVENVSLGLCHGHNIVLMCTEKHPFDCHRAILIARAFALQSIYAKHILPNGEIFTQQELDKCLLQKYFPDRNQLTLFSPENKMKEEDFLYEAYKLRNKEIGYHISLKKNEPMHLK